MYQAISDAIQACQLSGADAGDAAAGAAAKIDDFLRTYQGAQIL